MAGGAGQQDDKHSLAILWAIAGIFLAGMAIWIVFGEQLKFIFIKIRYAELYIISFFFKFIPIPTAKYEVQMALEIAQYATPYNLSADAANVMSVVSGKYLRIPIIIILLYYAKKLFSSNIKMNYKKRYDMKSLARQEANIWPQINPVIGLDLVNENLTEGPWAMAQTPMEFAKIHKLIKVHIEPALRLGEAEKYIATLDEEKAEIVFTKQLGRLWSGPEKLPIHKRALLAAMLARGCRDTDSAKKLIEQINHSANSKNPGKLNFDGADELWKKHFNKREIQEILNIHAYEHTFLIAIFLYAREDGVFPTSDFLWLKPIDRPFWYLLNNVGRQTPGVESAAAHAHFLAERSLQRALSMPMVKEAVKALKFALSELIYKPSLEEKDKLLKQYNQSNL